MRQNFFVLQVSKKDFKSKFFTQFEKLCIGLLKMARETSKNKQLCFDFTRSITGCILVESAVATSISCGKANEIKKSSVKNVEFSRSTR